MNVKKTLLPLILMVFSGAAPAMASPLDARDYVGYIKQGIDGSGWVNVSPATGGLYVNGARGPKNTARAAFMVGKPARQDYVFLTAEEQESIWNYRQSLR